MTIDYAARIERARLHMRHRGVDALLLSIGADLPYLTGYQAMPLERVTMLVLTLDGEPTLVVPKLEAPRVEPGPFKIEAWDETDDPFTAITAAAGRPTVAAVGDQTWWSFLLPLLARMSETTFVSAGGVMGDLRIRKDRHEISLLRAAAESVDRVSLRIPREVGFAGRSERAIARDIVDLMLEEGHDSGSFWIVASGPNGASPHHEPGDRICAGGDAVVVDFGGRMGGYCSDTTRTFVIGKPDPELVRVHAVVEEAQLAGREAAAAGVRAEQVDKAAREVVDRAGFGPFFIHRLGHGIGMETHEPPYLVAGNGQELEPGMAFSIEPGIYLSGRFGVRIEDICVIEEDGSAVALNVAPRGLVTVG
jgi:Xaa-Pro aminopeptidase